MFWLTSSHRWTYLSIALKYSCSPQLVYQIAHGKKSKSKKAPDIRQELIDCGLVRRVKRDKVNENV